MRQLITFWVGIIFVLVQWQAVHAQEDLCAAVDSAWGNDWEAVITALTDLLEQHQDCSPDQPSEGKLYAAHYNYGAQLESDQQIDAAITQYTTALNYRPEGREARQALRNLNAPLPPPPPIPACTNEQIELGATLPTYIPTETEHFVEIEGRFFTLDGQPFVPKGLNYFPSESPWRSFLTETSIETLEKDFELFQETGFNSLRVFLWYQPLFLCESTPNPQTFAFVDELFHLAAEHHFRLIVTLNDLADLELYPLYDDFEITRQQTQFIVERYKNEAVIWAWDVRNEGDLDYKRGLVAREKVYTWLASHTEHIRNLDSHHLITAGWVGDVMETEASVDFLSFHHWANASPLRNHANTLHSQSTKPILLEEFGYPTSTISPQEQSTLLGQMIEIASQEGLAGWMVWAAFDFPTTATCIPPACPSEDNFEHYFGIWDRDYAPKPAVETLQTAIQAPFLQEANLTIFEALILGILQGVAEFLPISSSGHLVLVPWWLGWDAPPLIYDVVVHVGTMTAILIFFWRDWLDLTLAGLASLRKRAITEPNERIFWSLVIGTIPAVIAGLLLEGIFEENLSEPRLVAAMLLVTASILITSERLSQFGRKLADMKLSDGLFIGLAQAVAIVPGISRSGSTIAAGLIRGLDRESAARYSFLLATPIILGAGAKQFLEVLTGDVTVTGDLTGVLIVGYLSSAIVGYASIAFLLNFIRRRSLYPFAIYCIIFGSISFIATFLR